MATSLQRFYVGGDMSFALYLIGFIVLIVGLAYGANIMHVAPRWIAVGAIVLTGLGIVTGVARTRQRDP
jgi:peptidoglycan/LPS O-acetylase OafA/YrhL